jgi:hypothetical protein
VAVRQALRAQMSVHLPSTEEHHSWQCDRRFGPNSALICVLQRSITRGSATGASGPTPLSTALYRGASLVAVGQGTRAQMSVHLSSTKEHRSWQCDKLYGPNSALICALQRSCALAVPQALRAQLRAHLPTTEEHSSWQCDKPFRPNSTLICALQRSTARGSATSASGPNPRPPALYRGSSLVVV